MLMDKQSRVYTPIPITEKYLWHFIRGRDLCKKIATFLEGYLWMARLDTFGDPYEGTVSSPTLNQFKKDFSGQRNVSSMISQEYAKFSKKSYASCWHVNNCDPTDEEWNSFADGGDGIVIKSTPELLLLATCQSKHDFEMYLGKVKYIDHAKDTMSDWNMLDACFSIRNGYKDENEARLLLSLSGQAQKMIGLISASSGDASKGSSWNPGEFIKLPCDPSVLIEEIVIGEKLSSTNKLILIEKMCKKYLVRKIRVS
jgi:hypothetical protein